MELTDEQQQAAARIQGILTAKGPDGEYRYTKNECRDFIVGCIFELGLPVTPELEGSMVSFLGEIEVPETASSEELIAAVRQYFVEHPLNSDLMKEFQAMGRNELLAGDEGFRTDAAEQARALSTVGKSGKLDKPEQKKKKAKLGLKSGLS